MKRKKNPGIIIISLLVIALFIGCTQTQKAQKANISVEMVETMTCELLGLKAYTMEIQIDSPAKSLDIITQDNRKRIPISGKQSIQITDYFTDSQNDTMKIQLINDKGTVIAEQNLQLSTSVERPVYSQFNEGIYFEESGEVSFYQLEYLPTLTLAQRIALYQKTQDETITAYVMLLKGGILKYCLYADYPVDTDDPSIEEFPHDWVYDVENDRYMNPKEEEPTNLPDTPPENILIETLTPHEVLVKWEDRCSNETEYIIQRQVEGQTDEMYTYGSNTEQATISVIPNTNNQIILMMNSTNPGFTYTSNPLLIHPIEVITGEEIEFTHEGLTVSIDPDVLPEAVYVSFSVSQETGNIITEFVVDEESLVSERGATASEIKGFNAFYTMPIQINGYNSRHSLEMIVKNEIKWWEWLNPKKIPENIIRSLFPETYVSTYRFFVDKEGNSFIYFGDPKHTFEILKNQTLDFLLDSATLDFLSMFTPKRMTLEINTIIYNYNPKHVILPYSKEEQGFSSTNKQLSFDKKRAIIFVHGMGNFSIDGLNGYWRTFMEMETDISGFNFDDYDKYAYWYDSEIYSAKQYGEELSDLLKNNGFLDHYEEIHIIAHSMGTIVTRYAMNHNNLGDDITNAFLMNGVLEGSFLANTTDYALYRATSESLNEGRTTEMNAILAELVLTFVQLEKEIENLPYVLQAQWELVEDIGNVVYELYKNFPDYFSAILINGINSSILKNFPHPGKKSICYTNQDFLNNLGTALWGQNGEGIFEHNEELKELNESDQYKNKYTLIHSDIVKDAPFTWEDQNQIGFRILNIVMKRMSDEANLDSEHWANDGMVPLWSQTMSGHNQGISENQLWYYMNLDHEQIFHNLQTVADIYEEIARDKTIIISLESDPKAGGDVSFDNNLWSDNESRTVEADTDVDIFARAVEGYRFVNWTKDGTYYSSNAHDTYTMSDEDVTLVANFEKADTPDPIPGMVLVHGGTFQMGNTRDDSEGDSNEKPVHTVNLTHDYYIGQYEVTFDEYDAYCEAVGKSKPDDRGWGRGTRPVMNVSWIEAIQYCNWLSEQEGLQPGYDNSGNLLNSNGQVTTDITQVEGYRLLTEAEWEYAARGGHEDVTNGNEANDYKYAGSNCIDNVAWYDDNSSNKTHEVGQKAPNEIGLYDMSGNVYEWCHDWIGSYTEETKTNPIGPNSAPFRVMRGGTWGSNGQGCRVAYRSFCLPDNSSYVIGLRIAKTRK